MKANGGRGYDGEPLVSIEADAARAAGLEIDGFITIGVLGIERDVRIANLRVIDWESMGSTIWSSAVMPSQMRIIWLLNRAAR